MSDDHDGARYRTSTTQRSLPVHMRSRWLYNETHLLILAERGVKTDRLTPPPRCVGSPCSILYVYLTLWARGPPPAPVLSTAGCQICHPCGGGCTACRD
jgi:hypothetical protein